MRDMKKPKVMSTEELLQSYEERLKKSLSPRLAIPARELQFLIAKIRAADKLLKSIIEQGTAQDAATATIVYMDIHLRSFRDEL